MSTNLTLNRSYEALRISFEVKQQLVEARLAELSLKEGLFGILSSVDLARTVAWEMVSMLQLSLQAGNFQQFSRQVEWEIGMALKRHGLLKQATDTRLVVLLENILLEQFDASLTLEIQALMSQVHEMFNNCWQTAYQRWQKENQQN